MPPTTSNESQGLKIATILLSILGLLLMIATYFGFSNAAKAEERAADAAKKAQESQSTLAKVTRTFDELKRSAGYEKIDASDEEGLRAAIQKDRAELDLKIKAMVDEVTKSVQGVQAKGGEKQLGDLLQVAVRTGNGIVNEPNRTFKSTLDRMAELMKDQSLLTTAMSVDNLGLRTELAQVNAVNDAKVRAAEEAAGKANEDLLTQVSKDEDARKAELSRFEETATQNRKYGADLAQLESEKAQMADLYSREKGDMLRQNADMKNRLAKQDIVLDIPDGKVNFVDYGRDEIRINVTRSQGVQPQMKFAIFDRSAPGIPSDKPKAMVQVIQVGDRDSVARIMAPTNEAEKSYRNAHPIHPGDLVYSASWDANAPKKFALVGKMDIDRDGYDDRDDLKQLIRQSGGEVIYDLPPPRNGKETGVPSGTIAIYVIDERPALYPERIKEDFTDEFKAYEQRKADVINKLRQEGVQPMPVERLLPLLGYTYGMARPGRPEAYDRNLSDRILYPRGRGLPASTENGGDSTAEPKPDQP